MRLNNTIKRRIARIAANRKPTTSSAVTAVVVLPDNGRDTSDAIFPRVTRTPRCAVVVYTGEQLADAKIAVVARIGVSSRRSTGSLTDGERQGRNGCRLPISRQSAPGKGARRG